MSMRLTEFADRRVWNLSGFTVDQICFDYRTIFLIAQAHSSLTVTIESPFTFQLDTQVEIVDEHSTSSRIAVLSLLHGSVESLTAYKTGKLVINFNNYKSITVESDNKYEAWQTSGTGLVADANMLCSEFHHAPWA